MDSQILHPESYPEKPRRLRGQTIALLLLAATLMIHCSAANAQVTGDLEITTDAGEKFHLVHRDGTNFDIYSEAGNKMIGSVDLRTQNPMVVGPDYAANGAAVSRAVAAAKLPGHMQSYSGPPIPGSPAPRTADQPVAAGELPPCPLGSVANYWNGTSWVPMRTADSLNVKQGYSIVDGLKNPFISRAGVTGIVRLRGTSAPITVASSPKFCFFLSQNQSATFLVGFVDVKGDHREIELHQRDRGPERWIPPKRQKPATTKLVGNSAIVTLNDPLPAGQYIVGLDAYRMYDFGVNASGS